MDFIPMVVVTNIWHTESSSRAAVSPPSNSYLVGFPDGSERRAKTMLFTLTKSKGTEASRTMGYRLGLWSSTISCSPPSCTVHPSEYITESIQPLSPWRGTSAVSCLGATTGRIRKALFKVCRHREHTPNLLLNYTTKVVRIAVGMFY
jgi:hypothetical protein